jgi:hypothetical protein
MWLKTKSLKVTGAWARERLRRDLPLPGGEMDDIAWGSEGKDTRYLGKPHRLFGQAARKGPQSAPVHGSENGRNEVSSNGGKQLIPADGV